MYRVTLSVGDQDTDAGVFYHLDDARARARSLLEEGAEARVFITLASGASYTERYSRDGSRLVEQVWSDTQERFVREVHPAAR